MTREAPIFFRSDVARRLSGTGDRADLIALLLAPGADAGVVAKRVRSALAQPGLRVLTGSKRGEAESPEETLSRADTIDGLTVFGVLAAFVAIFVVASTFALSVQQRHREFALFRAIGSTPRQVRKMVAGEALLVSLAAVAIASPISIFAARLLLDFSTRTGMVPEGLQIVIGWRPFAAGLVAAVVTTQLAAFTSARRASRIRPTDALRESSVQGSPGLVDPRSRRAGRGGRRSGRPDAVRQRARQQRPGGRARVDDRGRTARTAPGLAVQLADRVAPGGLQPRAGHAGPG